MRARLLIVEDESAMRQTLQEVFAGRGFTVFACGSCGEARAVLEREVVQAALLDVRLPDGSGLDLFREIQGRDAGTPCVFMTAYPRTREAVQALKEGAYDYVVKPFELTQLEQLLEKATEHVRLQSEVRRLRSEEAGAARFLGESPAARQLVQLVERVAASAGTHVLIRGESGAGKEIVAHHLHRRSPRETAPFVVLNCSAIPADLLEAELFGYEKGAYTDARAAKKGLLEMADGGTLFLDEIADLPALLQPKLLRVLDGSPYRRIGGLRSLQADVRFIAATNRDLDAAVREGRFRDDLYYRLKVMELTVPPLRERRDDVEELARHFLRQLGPAMGRPAAALEPEALQRLRDYSWPGNVRELRNVLERALIVGDGDRIGVACLPPELRTAGGPSGAGDSSGAADWTLESAKRRHTLLVLDRCGGNRSEASRLLGISRSTLKTLLKRYGLSTPDD